MAVEAVGILCFVSTVLDGLVGGQISHQWARVADDIDHQVGEGPSESQRRLDKHLRGDETKREWTNSQDLQRQVAAVDARVAAFVELQRAPLGQRGGDVAVIDGVSAWPGSVLRMSARVAIASGSPTPVSAI